MVSLARPAQRALSASASPGLAATVPQGDSGESRWRWAKGVGHGVRNREEITVAAGCWSSLRLSLTAVTLYKVLVVIAVVAVMDSYECSIMSHCCAPFTFLAISVAAWKRCSALWPRLLQKWIPGFLCVLVFSSCLRPCSVPAKDRCLLHEY